jgi:diguanylate cyclase (GGDEF)-like protein
MLPVSFIESGGTQNNVMGYVFLLVICVTFFFWGHLRIFMICSIIIMLNILLYIEFQFPQVVKFYPSEIHSIDRLTQTSVLLIIAFLFLKIFSDTYAKDRERLNKLVHYDSLTELLNRRSFDDELNKILERSNRKSEYIVFFDIDYFKEINDTQGHHYGDEVLQEMADELKKVFIYPNIVARWGGDEFVALYHGDYETLIQKIESLYIDIDLSFSCGITKLNDKDVSADAVLKRVDNALYSSKDNGRNQWTYQE